MRLRDLFCNGKFVRTCLTRPVVHSAIIDRDDEHVGACRAEKHFGQKVSHQPGCVTSTCHTKQLGTQLSLVYYYSLWPT